MDGSDPIYENELYKVVVGEPEHKQGFGGKIYKVVNKDYDVAEIETTLLIRAIYECNDLFLTLKAFKVTGDPSSLSDVNMIEVVTMGIDEDDHGGGGKLN